MLAFSYLASLPQIFFPSVAAVDKATGQYVAFGTQATLPDVRAHSSLAYPLRQTNKMSKVCYQNRLENLN